MEAVGRARVGVVVTGVHRARVLAVTDRVVVLAVVVAQDVATAVGVETAVDAGAMRAPWAPVSASSPS
ncbi:MULTISPECIES: hypothetical protein [unclassified Myxococcus]|uniref:hypothetical protein n=1 Tax=unclassified Myxococcus TaxID=2648731 RepID=UPI0015950AE9|nr:MULTISPECIES: hypothetical protein [unclassified Myxococcus]NVI99714.1 hypothetical protein [Myxococcus sp. AM009]NVJ14195.1 hypothetical protein [Myxococcus sp. AM010]WIG98375.1 hypothetical protein KGD87_13860 [Myxococcus sp. SDU36]